MPGIRIRSGIDVIVSLLRGKDVLLTVFTSLAKTEQDVVAELPVAEGKLLNDVPAALSGGRVEFTLRPSETLPVLIRTEN